MRRCDRLYVRDNTTRSYPNVLQKSSKIVTVDTAVVTHSRRCFGSGWAVPCAISLRNSIGRYRRILKRIVKAAKRVS